MSLSYVLALMEYWTCVGRKYTSNFTHHFITSLKVLRTFCDCCVCGLSCDCGLTCETAIKRNTTASIFESMCYFNRKLRLSHLGVASFREAINSHLATTTCYSMHTAVCNTNFSKPLALLQSFSSRITLKAE